MDIAKLSMNMSSAKVMTEVSMKVFKMSLDQMRDMETMITSLSAVSAAVSLDPAIGQNLDLSI